MKMAKNKRSASKTVKKGIKAYVWTALVVLVVLPCAVFFAFKDNPTMSWLNNGTSSKESGAHSGTTGGKDKRADDKTSKFSNKKDDGMIRVFVSKKGKYEEMLVEDYLTGVLCAEVPSDFDEEALKAQAIVSRTYAYARNKGNYRKRASQAHEKSPVCDDYAHCQAFLSKEDLEKSSKAFGKRKWKIMKAAVRATENEILMYDGKPANPLFHACSGGMTESATNVWGGAGAPYLKSVNSPGEDKVYDGFETSVGIEVEAYTAAMDGLVSEVGKTVPERDGAGECAPIQVVSRYKSGRVNKATYKEREVTGVQVRTALNLRSANFIVDMSKVNSEKKVYITTIGFGHGVGMSQYGAEAMARSGKDYKYILKHYYPGVELENIK